MTKKELAEFMVDSYFQGYSEAIRTLEDTKNAIPREKMVELFKKGFEGKKL